MTNVHRLRYMPSPVGSLYECEECSRLLAVDRSGALTIIDSGDALAVHRGGSDGLELGSPSFRSE